MSKNYIISVDLGGTKILTAILNDENKIIGRVKMPTATDKGADYIVECISESIEKALEENSVKKENVRAVCMGVPGTVDPKSGVIFNAPNLFIKNFNIKKALQKKAGLPVLIENDVNIGALGIKRFEFNNKVKNMLVVFIGTGIGGALIFDNKIYRGSNFFAGEIGHIKVNKNGYFAVNPDSPTFEGLASRTAVVASIVKEIKDGKKSKLSSFVKSGKKIKSKSLAKAYRDKDKIVAEKIDNSASVIGTVLGSLTTLLNVDTIVLGGGVIEALGEEMKNKIVKAFKKAVLKEPGDNVKIEVTKLGDDAALYGGPELAEEFAELL